MSADPGSAERLDRRVRIGHIHLKVADLDRALAFYRDIGGFEVTQRRGTQAAFLSAGGYHHHIGLNTWESRGGKPLPRGSTGLSTPPSNIPFARGSPTPFAASLMPVSPSTEPRIMASAKRTARTGHA